MPITRAAAAPNIGSTETEQISFPVKPYVRSVTWDCETFTMWIHMLVYVLWRVFDQPPKHMVKRNPAPCYKDWPSTVIVLDCTEVFIKAPSDLQANKVFSNYKQHDTAKFLVGTTEYGSNFYLAELEWSCQ